MSSMRLVLHCKKKRGTCIILLEKEAQLMMPLELQGETGTIPS